MNTNQQSIIKQCKECGSWCAEDDLDPIYNMCIPCKTTIQDIQRVAFKLYFKIDKNKTPFVEDKIFESKTIKQASVLLAELQNMYF